MANGNASAQYAITDSVKKNHQQLFKSPNAPKGKSPQTNATSNPSKRHRERLNTELDNVAALLPYSQQIINKLDKLSILRLAVSFLQVKTHLRVSVQKHGSIYGAWNSEDHDYMQSSLFKALGGFIVIINCHTGEIYFASENIEKYLGFHQSDVLHHPVFDLIHSEDRAQLRQNLICPYQLNDLGRPDLSFMLERRLTCRFRCLLDNTCGFMRLELRGSIAPLFGLSSIYSNIPINQNCPSVGLVAVCIPLASPLHSVSEPNAGYFKSRFNLNFALTSCDSRFRELVGLTHTSGTESELPMSLYRFVHHDDIESVMKAHIEAMNNGGSSIQVFRILNKKRGNSHWLQSNIRLFYKNGNPEAFGGTHRLLTEAEGVLLLEHRCTSAITTVPHFDDPAAKFGFVNSPQVMTDQVVTYSKPVTERPKIFTSKRSRNAPRTVIPVVNTGGQVVERDNLVNITSAVPYASNEFDWSTVLQHCTAGLTNTYLPVVAYTEKGFEDAVPLKRERLDEKPTYNPALIVEPLPVIRQSDVMGEHNNPLSALTYAAEMVSSLENSKNNQRFAPIPHIVNDNQDDSTRLSISAVTNTLLGPY